MNREIICRVKKTPAGELILGSVEDKLCLCDWKYRRMRPELDRKIQESLNARYKFGSCPVIEEASAQLDLYFKGELKAFRISLMTIGTEFQKRSGMRSCRFLTGKQRLTVNYPG